MGISWCPRVENDLSCATGDFGGLLAGGDEPRARGKNHGAVASTRAQHPLGLDHFEQERLKDAAAAYERAIACYPATYKHYLMVV